MTRCVKHHGYSAAALDIMYGELLPEKQNAMDLLSDAGFSLLGQTMLLPPIIFMFGEYFSPIHLHTLDLHSWDWVVKLKTEWIQQYQCE